MAGSYPDVPARRYAYDRDGSSGFVINTGGLSAMSTADLQSMNDEDAATGVFVAGTNTPLTLAYCGVIFPSVRDVAGYFVLAGFDGNAFWNALETSTDTSTGSDGTWTGRTLVDGGGYRSDIQSVTWTGIKAVRLSVHANLGGTFNWTQKSLHLYGTLYSTLRMWHPTLNQEIAAAAFDWGDIAAGTNGSRQFRVKNSHATQTAHSVVVTREALTDKTPSMVAQRLLSYGGSTPAASVSLGDLAPGAISGVITVDRDTISSSQAALGTLRYIAQAGSWS